MGERPNKLAKVGRPTRYTPKRGALIVKLVLSGVSLTEAAGASGIGKRTFFDWMKAGSTRAEALAREGLELELPEKLDRFEPPDLAAFSEAIRMARNQAAALHEANFARHAQKDWRASYAWLRQNRADVWGDHGRSKELERLEDVEEHEEEKLEEAGQDLAGEIKFARVRLAGIRKIIGEGGTPALPLDRALALEVATMQGIARLVKAQHEVNPAAGKTGDFRVLVELTEAASAVDMGPRVPDLEAGKKDAPAETPPEDAPRPEVGDEGGWGDL